MVFHGNLRLCIKYCIYWLNIDNVHDACYYLSISRLTISSEEVTMYKIDPELCTACGACMEECPEDAIEEGEEFYTITDKCIDCGSCAEVCPVDAISEG
jgi:formate hydrogenlyase subunit 6/NADH:ubiquinone oxidoreductase subunit I